MTRKKKKIRIRWRKRLLKTAGILFLLHAIQVVSLKWIDPVITFTQMQSVFDGYTLRRENIALSDLPPPLSLAVMASEDQLFAEHNGFDIRGIKSALSHNLQSTKLRGASTISQQVAKNVFLWQTRSWLRKGLEVYFTLLIEKIWGKRRILEVYLNVAELGPGVFGVEAASQYYFQKSARQLNNGEAALIAATLPSPKQYSPLSGSAHMKRKADWIVTQMRWLRSRSSTRLLLRLP